MSDREELRALAERVEALSGPCRETDALIEQALAEPDARYSSFHQPPAYTGSIDSAMSLVPEGWTWHVDATAPELGIDWFLCEPHTGRDIKGCAATPALALTAASLRALAQPTVPQP